MDGVGGLNSLTQVTGVPVTCGTNYVVVTWGTRQGDEITSTGDHPFWVIEGEKLAERRKPAHVPVDEPGNIGTPGRWVDARDLKVGDVFLRHNGKPGRVESLAARQEGSWVYNLHVDELNNFAVGNGTWLVHNRQPPIGGLPNSGATWGKNRLLKELHDRGFTLVGPSRRGGGMIYKNPKTGESVRIMPNPQRRPYRKEPSAKHEAPWYYRYQSNPNLEEGPHIPLPG